MFSPRFYRKSTVKRSPLAIRQTSAAPLLSPKPFRSKALQSSTDFNSPSFGQASNLSDEYIISIVERSPRPLSLDDVISKCRNENGTTVDPTEVELILTRNCSHILYEAPLLKVAGYADGDNRSLAVHFVYCPKPEELAETKLVGNTGCCLM
ncbi:hypothetical protein P9112_002356 [Eukaryota sp. TZLM1-RC]